MGQKTVTFSKDTIATNFKRWSQADGRGKINRGGTEVIGKAIGLQIN